MSLPNLPPDVIPVVLFTDVEPDPHVPNLENPEPVKGFPSHVRLLSMFREVMQQETQRPVNFSWLLRGDPLIEKCYKDAGYLFDAFDYLVNGLQEKGDETGVHIHMTRWMESTQDWIEDFSDPTWVAHCIAMSISTYKERMKRSPAVARIGGTWHSKESVSLMERLGVKVDLGIEPGIAPVWRSAKGMTSEGAPPNWLDVPTAPYWPTTEDYLKAGPEHSRSIRMLPLSSAMVDLGWSPKARWRHLRHCGSLSRWRREPMVVWKLWRAPNTYTDMISRAVESMPNPYLAIVGRSELTTELHKSECYRLVLEALMEHPLRKRFYFCTPQECLRVLDARSGVSARKVKIDEQMVEPREVKCGAPAAEPLGSGRT